MQRFKFLYSKNFFKIIFVLFCLFFLIISPFFVFNKSVYSLNLNEYFTNDNTSKVVLNLYHIETFEGGTNSRSKYLEEIALRFNKTNKNCFIVVKTLTPEQLILNLQENNLPDLFSFGVGVGEYIKGFLTNIDKNSQIRSDLAVYGEIDNKVYAYPYILSGYLLISYENYINSESKDLSNYLNNYIINNKEIKGFSISKGSNTLPILALSNNGINFTCDSYLTFDSSYEAYKSFISKNSVSLVGTLRDLARCKNRENLGTIGALKYNYLGNYTDLIQYISVVDTQNSVKTMYSKQFAKFLTQSDNQSLLSKYGLFSVNGKSIYDGDYMAEFERVLQNKLQSLNAFTSKEQLNLLENQNFQLCSK